MTLFHLSENPAITRFEPRPSDYTDRPVVWAIADRMIANYLAPRDCPRVCFRAGLNTSAEDRSRFLGKDSAVVAIEEAWVARMRETVLYRYTMQPERFILQDEGAGYFVSYDAIEPLGVELLDDLPTAIAAAGGALRVLPSLWQLFDAVAASSLVFSMIRMRNAVPRA